MQKKKTKKGTWQSPAHGHFCHLFIKLPSTQFSLHFREKIFWWAWGIKTRASQPLFPLPILTKHSPKSFPSLFSLLIFFILPKIHSTKHTLRVTNLVHNNYFSLYYFASFPFHLANPWPQSLIAECHISMPFASATKLVVTL